MSGYIGSKTSVTLVDGYTQAEADAEFVQDPKGSDTDGLTDLGDTNNRFKDLYLSGGVYLGGTGSANKLDDYEEGTFTGTITPASSGSVSLTLNELSYVKVGSLVTVVGLLLVSSVSSPAGTDIHLPLPFAVANLTDQAGRGGSCALWRRNATGIRAIIPLYFLEGSSTFSAIIAASTIGTNDEFSFSFSYGTSA